MSKTISTKPKPQPWIPPGRSSQRSKTKSLKPATKTKNDELPVRKSPERTFTLEKKEEGKDEEHDIMSVSSNSSSGEMDSNIYMFSLYQEMKLLYVHFASLKTAYLSTHRLIDFQSIEDSCINELLTEVGSSLKDMNNLFEDLEYAICTFENTLNDDQKIQEYAEVFKIKEKLLSKLFELYEKVIIIFQTTFEKQDFKELSELQVSLNRKLQAAEKKCISQEAVIKDLERKLSIYQSKTNSMESYKTNLENAKGELEKQLLYKESQIKYLSNELLNSSGKQTKSDHEDLIEIMEGIKSKAHSEKSALKKALKFQKTQSEKTEEKYQKLMQESSEKEKMMFDIAAQRDQLKVQLTVVNNSLIQQKNQIEEMKLQNLKLQNEMSEQDASHKKEINELQGTLEEKNSLLDKTLKTKKNLENNIEELENELQAVKKKFKNLKIESENKSSDFHESKDTNAMFEEMNRLTSLLQNTKEVFESLKQSIHLVSAGGDNMTKPAELGGVENEILAAVKETKNHLLELRDLYKTFLEEQKGIQVHPKKNNLEKQLQKLEELYSESMKENEALKLQVEELKNNSLASSAAKRSESFFATNMPTDNFTRKLQLELMKTSDEILKMKYDFKQKERELEDQLKEYKDKFRTMEFDSSKIASLEEELKNTKLELSTLQQNKRTETDRLLCRTKELQDSLDFKSAEYESLQRYVQLLKSSYFNVFGSS